MKHTPNQKRNHTKRMHPTSLMCTGARTRTSTRTMKKRENFFFLFFVLCARIGRNGVVVVFVFVVVCCIFIWLWLPFQKIFFFISFHIQPQQLLFFRYHHQPETTTTSSSISNLSLFSLGIVSHSFFLFYYVSSNQSIVYLN